MWTLVPDHGFCFGTQKTQRQTLVPGGTLLQLVVCLLNAVLETLLRTVNVAQLLLGHAPALAWAWSGTTTHRITLRPGYLWLAHGSDEDYPFHPDVAPSQLQVNGPLVTTMVVRWAFTAIHESPSTAKRGESGFGGGFFGVGTIGIKSNSGKRLGFMRIGHSIWALLFIDRLN